MGVRVDMGVSLHLRVDMGMRGVEQSPRRLNRMEEGKRSGLVKKRIHNGNEANRNRLQLGLVQRRAVLEQRRGKEDKKREKTTLPSLLHRLNQVHYVREVVEVVV